MLNNDKDTTYRSATWSASQYELCLKRAYRFKISFKMEKVHAEQSAFRQDMPDATLRDAIEIVRSGKFVFNIVHRAKNPKHKWVEVLVHTLGDPSYYVTIVCPDSFLEVLTPGMFPVD